MLITLADKFDETLEIRKKIVDIFMTNVNGRKADTTSSDPKHAGKEGHWLEKQMGVAPNASNEPDLMGYEMKTETSPITVGSFDPNYWIFRDEKRFPNLVGKKGKEKTNLRKKNQNDFLNYFGKPNKDKNDRMSWSGSPIPKIGKIHSFGMKITISEDRTCQIFYSFSDDKRENKKSIIPERFQTGQIEIARWDASNEESIMVNWNSRGKKSIREKWNEKWNRNGWFICRKGKDKKYNSIVFGRPQKFEFFVTHFKTGEIYFDSGMHYGNPRNYCQWRTSKKTFDKLIVETYP